MSLLALEVAMPGTESAPDDDAGVYRRMARRYLASPPSRKRSLAALTAAAEELGFDLVDLRAQNRKRPIMIARKKAMAFAFVISECSMREVARVMRRSHATAIRAIEKYQDEVKLALGGKYESRK